VIDQLDEEFELLHQSCPTREARIWPAAVLPLRREEF
jgi:hypothetical protein